MGLLIYLILVYVDVLVNKMLISGANKRLLWMMKKSKAQVFFIFIFSNICKSSEELCSCKWSSTSMYLVVRRPRPSTLCCPRPSTAST